MSSTTRLDVVVCWHMHQPEYRVGAVCTAPWTYLHALKDYADMAAHLEAVPAARAVVNFTPILLRQIRRQADELRAHLEQGAALTEPLLAALVQVPTALDARATLVRACMDVNERTMLGRWPALAQLVDLGRRTLLDPALLRYLNEGFFVDLVVWFHLAWLGEARRRADPLVQELIVTGGDFTRAECRGLLELIGYEIGEILPRYRALAKQGRIELSLTPWGHPILPLLLDLQAGREALPESSCPNALAYPGGHARARWHLEHAIAEFEREFGVRPVGCWPSEGALSRATLQLLDEMGFSWTASGGGVLGNSEVQNSEVKNSEVKNSEVANADCIHTAYALEDQRLRVFFRDDGLSDLIGFTYQHWDAEAAVEDLVQHLQSIHRLCPTANAIVPIVLDGENAWEHFPNNGHEFLRTLYQRLAAHPEFHLTTFSAHLARNPSAPMWLRSLKAGSWVHGTLSTWVGNAPRNRAWDLLVRAKHVWDAHIGTAEEREKLDEMLGICEGSDWFWWLSEQQNATAVARLEALYRDHLKALYRALDVPVPDDLHEVLCIGQAEASAASMQRST